jgi:predicted phage baseplate assembly protein
VVGGSLQVTTIENGQPLAWLQRSDFDAASPADRQVVLDSETSSLVFGDGNQGRIPPTGAQIRVTYEATLGKAGNQPAGLQLSLAPPSTLSDQVDTLSSPLPATSGEDAETLADAAGRTVAELQAPTRAITSADYEWLALRTPGTALARARALPGYYEPYAGLAAPGVVTLIVVPDRSGPRPTPGVGLLRSVRQYLDRRRIVGTHLEVVGPTYVQVQVQASVRARQGADAAIVQVNVLEALEHFFDPLRGGADSAGWPFGRAVYRAEVLQVIDAADGVDTVLSLDMSADGQPAQCGNLCVRATQLIASGQHLVQVMPA